MSSVFSKRGLALLLPALLFFLIGAQAQTKLWGVTIDGGAKNQGVVFTVDPDGTNLELQKEFEYTTTIQDGYPLGRPLFASNGKVYAMTGRGGNFGQGAIFEYDISTSTYISLYSFAGGTDGKYPSESLIQASDGNIYGVTTDGGQNSKGIIFEFNPSSLVYAKRYDFVGGNDGSFPMGRLTEAPNGKLYGMNLTEGTDGVGGIFEFNPSSGAFVERLSFTTIYQPTGHLTLASNGKLYGMTQRGGAFDNGSLFEYVPGSTAITVLVDFDYSIQAVSPAGSVVEANNGKLYGVTELSGVSDNGALFEYDPGTSQFSVRGDMTEVGSYLGGTMILAGNGKLYGSGNNNVGNSTLFEFDPSTGNLVKKVEFPGQTYFTTEVSELAPGPGGVSFAFSSSGGLYNNGAMFSYDPGAISTTSVFDFGGATDGTGPNNTLILAPTGKLYGITETGGLHNNGVIFEIDPTNSSFEKKVDFQLTDTGATPVGALCLGNGKLYGTTIQGGADNYGTLFSYAPTSNTFTKLADFDDSHGISPFASVTMAPNGKLYGTTLNGGVNNKGTIYEYDTVTTSFLKKADFDGAGNGANSHSTMTLASNGKLYGVTRSGGTNGHGVVFEFNPATSSLTKKADFNGPTTGQSPRGKMTLASNGRFYGLAQNGGTTGLGTLYEFNPGNGVLTAKVNFDGNNGSLPVGGLTQVGNLLLGMAAYGGAHYLGVLFTYNLSTGQFTKKFDFDGTLGAHPWRAGLTLVGDVVAGISESNATSTAISVYPVPFTNVVTFVVKSPADELVTYQLVDPTGKEFLRGAGRTNEPIVAGESLAEGMYLLRVLTGGESLTRKVVKR